VTSGTLHKRPAGEHERMNSELRRGIYLSHRYGGTQRLVNRLEHRLVASLLRRLPRPLRILDIPSGYGRFTPQLEDAAATPLVCSDVDHRRLAVLGPTEGVHPSAPFYVLADLTGPLPFASGVFDLVFNFRYFHHVGDRQQRRDTLAELVRISRRYLIVSYYDRPLIHLAVKKLQYLPRRPRRRTVDMVPSREFKRLFQTLGCRVLADRAILPGLHAQRVALVEKVNSSGAAPGNSVPPTPLDPSPGAIAVPGQPGVAPTVARPAPPSAVWVGRRASTAPHERRSGRGWAARRQGK